MQTPAYARLVLIFLATLVVAATMVAAVIAMHWDAECHD